MSREARPAASHTVCLELRAHVEDGWPRYARTRCALSTALLCRLTTPQDDEYDGLEFGTAFQYTEHDDLVPEQTLIQPSENGLSSSVQRALEVLEAIAEAPSDMGISELARRFDRPKSSIHRSLVNLERRGLVERDPVTSRYAAGLRLLALGSGLAHRLQSGTALPPGASAIFRRAVEQVGETGYLAILDRDEVLYIDSVEGGDILRATAPIGTRRPVFCTAVGKVLIAGMDPVAQARVLGPGPFEPRTPKTVTDRKQLERDLETIDGQGYAVDVEEYAEGLVCLGAPIKDAVGRVIAAIGLTGPIVRLSGERLEFAIKVLTAAAAESSLGPTGSPDPETTEQETDARATTA
jgi:DNA-binding IclR family transcriptional regulator